MTVLALVIEDARVTTPSALKKHPKKHIQLIIHPYIGRKKNRKKQVWKHSTQHLTRYRFQENSKILKKKSTRKINKDKDR